MGNIVGEYILLTILISSIVCSAICVVGIDYFAERIKKSTIGKALIDFLYGKGQNMLYIIITLNIVIMACIGILFAFALISFIFGDKKKKYMLALYLIPLTFISMLLFFSIEYEKEEINMFYDQHGTRKGKVFDNILLKSAGNTMCIIFLTFYTIALLFVYFLDNIIYKRIVYYQKENIKNVSENQLEKTDFLNNYKLTLLYYFFGLIIGSYVILLSAYYGDQEDPIYDKIFCNTDTFRGREIGANGSSGTTTSNSGEDTGSGSLNDPLANFETGSSGGTTSSNGSSGTTTSSNGSSGGTTSSNGSSGGTTSSY